jgi:biotin carboxyl carrier protein
MRYTAIIGDQVYEVEIAANAGLSGRAGNVVIINGETHTADFQSIDGVALYSLLLDNQSWESLVEREGDEYRILIDGELHVVSVQDERSRKIAKGIGKMPVPTGEVIVKAPMPGLVRGVNVQMGDEVKAHQGIVILEAMKMENELRVPRAGVVKEIRAKEGDRVELGQVLVIVK